MVIAGVALCVASWAAAWLVGRAIKRLTRGGGRLVTLPPRYLDADGRWNYRPTLRAALRDEQRRRLEDLS